MYVALRMGALPWPTLFVAIMSRTVLKALKNTNLNEINVTHTIMSAGLIIGIVLYIIKVPSTLGLGIYLPMMIISAVALGGLAI